MPSPNVCGQLNPMVKYVFPIKRAQNISVPAMFLRSSTLLVAWIIHIRQCDNLNLTMISTIVHPSSGSLNKRHSGVARVLYMATPILHTSDVRFCRGLNRIWAGYNNMYCHVYITMCIWQEEKLRRFLAWTADFWYVRACQDDRLSTALSHPWRRMVGGSPWISVWIP